MSLYTAIVLLVGLVNAAWFAHFFVLLIILGHYDIQEPNRWIAILELAICLISVCLMAERLIRLKEWRKKK
jgi:hypothetical protein